MSSEPTRHADQMSDLEALMWHLEQDPRLSSNVANLSILDCAPDRERLRDTMVRAASVFPRLRQRVQPVMGRLAPPLWEIDPEFDIDRHLRWERLSGTRSRAELHRFVAARFAEPFDRSHPLWEFVVIEGLRDGRCAMLQRIHHTITDGEGGLRLSLEFLDFERHPTPRSAIHAVDPSVAGALRPLGSVGTALSSLARKNLDLARKAVEGTARTMAHPNEWAAASAEAVGLARATIRQAQVGDRPLSPLWTERSLDHWFGTLDVDFDRARSAAKRLGGTLNDLFVTGACLGAGAYHREHDTPVASLRMAMPISSRSDHSIGGNVFAPTQLSVPADDVDPAVLFTRVHHALATVKGESTLGVTDALAAVVNFLPMFMVRGAGQRVAGSIDFVTSNLRAAPMDMFLAGALIESNYPLGPVANTAFNLTTMSYRGSFCMGLQVDTAAISDPELLRSGLVEAYRALLKATA